MNNFIRKNTYFRIIAIAGILFMMTTGCKKETTNPSVQETGTVSDLEGNVYKTVKIGDLWWMAENLKSRRFRNGIYIAQSITNPEWADTTASYCVYPSNNSSAPGYLYNGYAVTDTGNIAPPGWHIPTDAEWKDLEKNVGMTESETEKSGWRGTDEAGKLKIQSVSTGWTSYGSIFSDNESGFSAVGGSCRIFNGTWGDPGLFKTGFWWTASAFPFNNELWYRYLDYQKTTVFRSHCYKAYGYSIRCVKDH